MIATLLAIALIPQPAKLVQLGGVVTNPPIIYATDSLIAAEGYRLRIDSRGVQIASSDDAGKFYAGITLNQLAEKVKNGKAYPWVEINDAPQFHWRGILIDDCRHFFGKETIKRTLDQMAQHKLNVLHWHLTDDQGWRIDVPGYPELVKYGSVRPSSPKYGARMRKDSAGEWQVETNTQEYGPFYYTEADFKEVIAYAAERHIKIVPEIELPGHAYTALVAYPDLACCPERILAKRFPRCCWGIEKDVLCIGNDKAIKFMEDVVDYICRVFPSDVVHIGGDECPNVRWKTCPKCQARIKASNLRDETDLQPWITRHFVKFLAARGKRALGWDEYLLGAGIPKSAIGMSWRVGRQGAGHEWLSPADIAAKGHDIVMTPTKFCYIDYGQGLADDPHQYIGGKLPLKQCYALDPCAGIAPELRSHVLGGQGNCWSEYTWNQFDLEWKTWPRACALAEVFWTGDKRSTYEDFISRMRVHRKRLIAQSINCAPLE